VSLGAGGVRRRRSRGYCRSSACGYQPAELRNYKE